MIYRFCLSLFFILTLNSCKKDPAYFPDRSGTYTGLMKDTGSWVYFDYQGQHNHSLDTTYTTQVIVMNLTNDSISFLVDELHFTGDYSILIVKDTFVFRKDTSEAYQLFNEGSHYASQCKFQFHHDTLSYSQFNGWMYGSVTANFNGTK